MNELTRMSFPANGLNIEKLISLLYFNKESHAFPPSCIEAIYFLRNHSDAIRHIGFIDKEMKTLYVGLEFNEILNNLTPAEWEYLESILVPEESPAS